MLVKKIPFGKTHLSRPLLISAALGVGLTHHVGSLFVVVDTAKLVTLTGRNGSDTVKRSVLVESILNVLGRCGLESFSVRVLQGGNGAGLVAGVTG